MHVVRVISLMAIYLGMPILFRHSRWCFVLRLFGAEGAEDGFGCRGVGDNLEGCY